MVGLALLAHPMGLVVFLMGVPIWLFLFYLELRKDQRTSLTLVPLACILGFALAAFWLVPFASKGSWMAKYGELWLSLPEMGRRIWAGSLFGGTTPAIIWAALGGGAVAVVRRHFGGLFCVVFAGVIILVSSKTLFHELDLLTLSSSFGQIQFQRFVIPAKPLVFALAGYLIWSIPFLWAQARPTGGEIGWKGAMRWAIVGACIGPFVWPLVTGWSDTYGKGVGTLTVASEQRHRTDYMDFLEWSKTLHSEDEFFRVAYVRPYNDHIFASAPVFNELPAYKVGFTPCTNFRHKPDTGDDDTYKKLSVKYVVATQGMRKKNLKEVKRFGAIRVYEFLDYQSRRYTLKGPGKVTMADIRPHDGIMEFTLEGTTPETELVVHVAPFPNWVARGERGTPLELSSIPMGDKGALMGLSPQNGRVTLLYESPRVNVLAGALSGLAWLLLLVLGGLFGRKWGTGIEGFLGKVGQHSWVKWGRPIVGVGGVGLCIVVGAFFLRGESNGSVEMLERAEVWVERSNGEQVACPKTEEGVFRCSEKGWNYVGRTEARVGGAIRRCVWAHPTEKGPLHIQFQDVLFGSRLEGAHGLADGSFGRKKRHGSTKIDVLVNGAPFGQLKVPAEKGWHSWELDTSGVDGETGTLEWIVSATRTGKQHYCFDGGPVLLDSDAASEKRKEVP